MGPFIMNAEGVGRIFGPLAAFADDPFLSFYEPIESPIANPMHPQQSNNPVVKKYSTAADKYGTPEQGFNIVCTTYRLTEHIIYWTKNNPMNVRACCPSRSSKSRLSWPPRWGLKGGEKVKVSRRAQPLYPPRPMVTRRIKPMMIDGKKTYQIGIPIHWGYRGIKEDEGLTALTPCEPALTTVVDPNAYTPEFKGFLVKLERA